MKLASIIRQAVRRTDGFVMGLLGEHRKSQQKIVIPKLSIATQVRREFIKDYVGRQPSLLQIILLKLYVTARHMIGSAARRLLRVYRRNK